HSLSDILRSSRGRIGRIGRSAALAQRNPKQVENGRDEGQRVRRTTRYIECWTDFRQKRAVDSGGTCVEPARDRARAYGDQEAWLRHGAPGETDGVPHVLGQRSTQDERVRVSWRRDPLDPVALQIEIHVRDRVELELASVTAAGRYLSQ